MDTGVLLSFLSLLFLLSVIILDIIIIISIIIIFIFTIIIIVITLNPEQFQLDTTVAAKKWQSVLYTPLAVTLLFSI